VLVALLQSLIVQLVKFNQELQLVRLVLKVSILEPTNSLVLLVQSDAQLAQVLLALLA